MIPMTQDERNELYLAMRSKKLKAKNVAQEIDVSPSLLSQFFSFKANMNIENENNLKKYITEYEG